MTRAEYGYLPDQPVTADEELWPEVKQLGRLIAGELSKIPPTSPVLLSGDWGSGKTTLLRAIQRQIETNRASPDTPRTIFFEAWRYEGAGPLLPLLMRAIWEEVPTANQPSEELKAKLWTYALAACVGMAGAVSSLAGGLVPLLLDGLLAVRAAEAEARENPKLKPPENATLALNKNFRELIGLAWSKDFPLIVIIDDLDRCSPEGAVHLIDAIRHLVNGATQSGSASGEEISCRFVVALDRRILAHSILSKFGDFNVYDSNLYIKKLFPIVFDLPRPSKEQVGSFVRMFLKNTTGDADAQDALVTALANPLFANPRLMKRCINRFYLVLSFESRAESKGVSANRGPQNSKAEDHLLNLAQWIAATELWPNLRDLLHRKSAEAWRHSLDNGSGKDANREQVDAEIAEALREEGASDWVTRAFERGAGSRLKNFREADERLRKWGL